MADDDRKLSWRAINRGSISSILCLDNGGRGLEVVSWGGRNIGGNYAIWKSGSGQAIISSSSLFWPYWLLSKTEQRLLVWGNKEWLHCRKNQRQKTGMSHCVFSLCSMSVFSITKKYPSAPGILRQQWLPQVTVCSLRVNTGCECDMSGQMCSFQSVILSVQQRVWGHRLLVGPSADSPLKWGKAADWQCRWTPDCTCPVPPPFALIHGKNTSIFLSPSDSYSALEMDFT